MHQSLDASSITPSLFSKWPRAASGDWIWPYVSGDPFYVETISWLTMSDPGCCSLALETLFLLTFPEFGGTTQLQATALRNDKEGVAALSKRAEPLIADRNFRGQTVLHLVVLNPAMITHVLKCFSDIDVNAQDGHGTTPLMYAMAYGVTRSSQLLLEAGADPFCRDELNGFCAWNYALVCANEELLAASIDAYSTKEPEHAELAVMHCLWSRMFITSARSNDFEGKILSYLLQFQIGHDDVSPCGNTLLTLGCSWEVEIMLRNTTIPVNQKNNHGYTPLMVITRFQDPSLISKLVEQGATVDVVDEHLWNALHHLTSNLMAGIHWGVSSESWLSGMESAAVLLRSGIASNKGDDCKCPCSSSGCTPSVLFVASGHWSRLQARTLQVTPWLLEWFMMVQHQRPAEVYAILMTLYRRQRFDELGMTHTCCRRREMRSSYSGRKAGFISPIDDEIERCYKEKGTSDDEEYEESDDI